MRPQAIRRFDLCFLGSLALSTVAFALGYAQTVAAVRAQTAQAGLEMGSGLVLTSFLAGIAINLLLWFLVSRKRVGFVKWIIAILTALGLVNLPTLFANGLGLIEILSLAAILLQVAAVYFLFQPGAAAWFKREPVHPDTFE